MYEERCIVLGTKPDVGEVVDVAIAVAAAASAANAQVAEERTPARFRIVVP